MTEACDPVPGESCQRCQVAGQVMRPVVGAYNARICNACGLSWRNHHGRIVAPRIAAVAWPTQHSCGAAWCWASFEQGAGYCIGCGIRRLR